MTMVCEDTITRQLKNGSIRYGYYIHKTLKANLDFEIKRVNRDWDCIFVVDGEEGSAKTTVACTMAHYMSSQLGTKFDLDDIIYTPEQFNEWIHTQPPGSVAVWDEFVLAGMSADALTKIQNTIVKQMTIMRKKRLIVILVIPYLFMLRKYFAIARTRCLIHVYSPNNLDRGSFMYFSKPWKRMLYMKGIKYWEYGVWKPDFIGDFTNTFGLFFDVDAYNDKKDEALKILTETVIDKRNTLWKGRLYTLIKSLMAKGETVKAISKDIKMDYENLRNFIKHQREKEEKEGGAPDIKGSQKPQFGAKEGYSNLQT